LSLYFQLPAAMSTPPIVGFFFSSRRRHTRFSRDWSSDVCSSDLRLRLHRCRLTAGEDPDAIAPVLLGPVERGIGPVEQVADRLRSEERRVGKEGRIQVLAVQ